MAEEYIAATERAIEMGKNPIRFSLKLLRDEPPSEVPVFDFYGEVKAKAKVIKERTVGLTDREIFQIAEANVKDSFVEKTLPDWVKNWNRPDPYRTPEEEQVARMKKLVRVDRDASNQDKAEPHPETSDNAPSDESEEDEINHDGFLDDVEAMFVKLSHGKWFGESTWESAKESVQDMQWRLSVYKKANAEGKDPRAAMSEALKEKLAAEEEKEH
jgi:hypothetical protein